MTTEQLRLEIQVLVKEALVNLKQTSSEYKRLAEEAKKAAPAQYELNAAIARIDHDLKTSAQAAKLFGDSLGGMKEQQARLKAGITDLLDRGLAPESKEVQQLKARYDDTTAAIKRHGDGVDGLKGKIESLITSAALAAATTKIVSLVGGAVGAFAQAEASAQRLDLALEMRGMQAAKGPLNELAASLQQLTGIDGDLVTQIEAELLAQGKNQAQIEKTIKAAAGLSAVTGEDLNTSVQKLSSTYSGSARELGKNITVIKDLTEEQLKQGMAIDIMAQKYSGYIGKTGTTAIAMARLRENLGDVTEAFGSGFAPAVRVGADLLAGLADALKNASGAFKTVAAIVTTVIIGALVGLTLRTAVLTAAKWGLFGATTAVNAAMAVGNPLLWVGIAAAVAAVAVTTALVVAKTREARAITDGAAAARDATEAYNGLAAAAEAAAYAPLGAAIDKLIKDSDAAFKRLLKQGSLEQLQAELKKVQKSINEALKAGYESGGAFLKPSEDQLERLQEEIERRQDQAASDLAAALKRLQDFRAQFAAEARNYADQAGGDPFAALETERINKMKDAFALMDASGVRDTKLIRDIIALYGRKMTDLSVQLDEKAKDAMAKITATRVDDLEIEKRNAIKSFTGTEQDRAQIAAYYDKLIADTRIDEDKRAAAAKIEAEATAAAAAFDLANRQRGLDAKVTKSQVDDLELALDRELALFKGAEEEKLALARGYAKAIADAKIAEDKRAFEEALYLAKSKKDYGQVAALSFQKQAAGTDIGKIAGFAGGAAMDPITMLIEEFLTLALQIENVNKVLNPLGTIMEGVFKIIEPLLSGDLQGMVDALMEAGMAIGEILSPAISILGILFSIAAGVMKITVIPALQMIGAAYVWLNNNVIVPFGNAIIDIINGVISGINYALGFLGVHIALLPRLQTVSETYVASQEELNAQIDQVNGAMDDLRKVFDDKKKDIQEAYDKNVSALQDLLQVGALSGAEYDSMVAAYNTQLDSDLALLDDTQKAQLATLNDMLNKLNNGIPISNLDALLAAVLANIPTAVTPPAPVTAAPVTAAPAAAGVTSRFRNPTGAGLRARPYAAGAAEIPRDQLALVHAGETIVPESFAEAIRSGNLVLGKSAGTSNLTTVSLTVNGSVLTEEDLLNAIAKGLAKKTKRGTLPSEAMN